MNPHAAWIVPELPVPGVRALITTRPGGVSQGPWGAPDGGGMNLGLGSGDAIEAVRANRARLEGLLPQPPRWLKQVHGATVVAAETVAGTVEADAATSVTPGVVCAVLVADCLPVLLASGDGRGVAVAHAGWRGIAAGVIQNTAHALRRRLGSPDASLVAYLGPGIGPRHFEVGPDVLAAMRTRLPGAEQAFTAANDAKYRADLFALAAMALAQVGVDLVPAARECTYSDPARFYSYRRDGITGRHAALIWIEPQPAV